MISSAIENYTEEMRYQHYVFNTPTTINDEEFHQVTLDSTIEILITVGKYWYKKTKYDDCLKIIKSCIPITFREKIMYFKNYIDFRIYQRLLKRNENVVVYDENEDDEEFDINADNIHETFRIMQNYIDVLSSMIYGKIYNSYKRKIL